MAEMVLPSGRFATIRTPTVGDLVNAYQPNSLLMMVILAHRTVKIDDKQLSLEDWLNMEAEEFFPVSKVMGEMLTKVLGNMKGIA